MTCNDLKKSFDDYVDGALDDASATRLKQHVSSCDACQQLVNRELKLRNVLRDYGESSVPTPSATYFDRALVAAARAGSRQQQKRSWMTGFGSAVAAGLAIWIFSSALITAPDTAPSEANIPAITMSLAEPRTVNLVFSSASVLENATLTLLLPEGIELAGFAGQREITWMTDLKKGKNFLPLQLIATEAMEGELLATLRHGQDDRTFRLRIDVI